MDRTEAMIRQHLYWTDIRDAVWKEVTNYDTCQRTKQSNKKYGKLPAKEAEEIPCNKNGAEIFHEFTQEEIMYVRKYQKW